MSAHKINIAEIRRDYQLAELDETICGDDPLIFFGKWFAEAEAAQIGEVNAMALATVDAASKPHARIVLLKGLDEKGFVFYTNYQSAKGNELNANPHAALIFFWKELERQVRIEGAITKTSETESNQYFNSRPEGSRLSAWASPQSQLIANRTVLDDNYKRYHQKYSGTVIPRPENWGGYRLTPSSVEFWQGRSNRLHDRLLFEKNDNNKWEKKRLAP